MSNLALLRTRWAAIGAAVAVTLGAGSFVAVEAAVTSGERTVFVPITPCRLVDTRPSSTVGPKSSPVGPGEVHTVTAHGTNGDCTIPADAVALSLNVTALGATLPTFLTVWPAGAAQPDSSSLNPSPGQPPTPNAVTTDLSGDGRFSVFNLQGSVDILVDVNGYYADHNHDDRYYTKAQADAQLGLTKFISINVFSDPGLNFDARWAGLADAGVGGLNTDVDFSFTVPPDFTPGSPVEIRVLAYARNTGTLPCNGDLSVNWLRAMRAGQGPLPTGSPRLTPNDIPHVFATANVAHEFVFTSNPTLQLQPGDSVGFGLYNSGGSPRCTHVISGVGVYYS